ncbi:hypothetical protein NHX12_025977 [Muraenolepis orangiensis]|uniref:Transcription cofactor vestigial-like protein 2 n=1 Tax=Muraenolepis orangiensis TaxID=630683 RepID=A0A9Q0EGP9_9TELE|nr:hypothetical protein NHX12_025977 [Muraenolepis orangiensis]
MSCLDVMYQVYGTPPQPYFATACSPYHHQKLEEEEDSGRDKEPPPEAEYLSSRCVLFTYFQGDISSVVDEHFSRALSHPGGYAASGSGHSKSVRSDGPFPMNQRSFPPSFWNSAYQSSSGAASSGLHGGALGAQGSPGYPRPGAHHEVYGAAAFDPRYGSLLVPSVRSHHRLAPGGSGPAAGPGVSPCDPGGKGELAASAAAAAAWSGAFTGAGPDMALNMDTGLQTQDKSKDLYWF